MHDMLDKSARTDPGKFLGRTSASSFLGGSDYAVHSHEGDAMRHREAKRRADRHQRTQDVRSRMPWLWSAYDWAFFPGAGGSGGTRPLQCSSGTGLKVLMTPGSVNSFVPTLGGSANTGGESPQTSLSVTGTGVICVVTAWNADPFSSMTSADVQWYASHPDDTDTASYQTIATVTVSSGAITNVSPVNMGGFFVQRVKCGTSPAQYYWNGV